MRHLPLPVYDRLTLTFRPHWAGTSDPYAGQRRAIVLLVKGAVLVPPVTLLAALAGRLVGVQ